MLKEWFCHTLSPSITEREDGNGEKERFISVITARKRSLGQGNIFRSLCQEFCPGGGVLSQHALQVVSQHALQQGSVLSRHALQQGVCCREVPGPGRVPGLGGAWSGGAWSRGSAQRGCLVETPPGSRPPGAEPPQDGYCCGRYASYWKEFLYSIWNNSHVTN